MAKKKSTSRSKNHRWANRKRNGATSQEPTKRTSLSRLGRPKKGQGSPTRRKKKPRPTGDIKRRGPLYQGPEEDGVTNSFLGQWMECREQAALNYIDGYTAKGINVPTEFGSIMHYAIEHQFNYSTPEQCINSITKQYREWRSPTLLYRGEQDTLEELLGLANVTFPAYCHYWHEDDKKISWIGREQKFCVPYEVDTPEGKRKILLRGMRDGLYRVPKTNKLGVFETKNKSRIDESDIHDGLKADMQTMFYVFVTYLETGEMPEQVLYNVIRRTNKQRLKGRGKNPIAETAKEYVKRIKEDIKAKQDDYFKRWAVDLVIADVKKFKERTLDPLLVCFIQWHDSLKKNPTLRERWTPENQSPYHFRNYNALNGKYGKSFYYEAIVNNNLRPYSIRTAVFPELADSFQATH